MRVAKPLHPKREGRNLRRERRRWDDAEVHQLPLGCMGCADRPLCGGMHKKQRDFDCLGDCCGNPGECDTVCPRNFDRYVEFYREVDGFDLANIPRATPCLPPDLPEYVPYIFHRNRRTELLDVPVVALPLHKFYSRRGGDLRYKNRAEIEATFRIKRTTRIMLIGSGRDKPIEGWWGLSTRRRDILQALADLGIELVTSPNYSLFTDVPRHDNLYNMKRIAWAWYEATDEGLPSAIHLNARTDQDYARLAAFIQERPEITDVSFEFKTGGAWRGRRDFHHRHLARIARNAKRPLRLIMMGGLAAIPSLAPAYGKITFVDTTAFMKALYRQRLFPGNDGGVLGIADPTKAGAGVDSLLRHNIKTMRTHIEGLVSDARAKVSAHDSEPLPGTHPSDFSERGAPASGRRGRH